MAGPCHDRRNARRHSGTRRADRPDFGPARFASPQRVREAVRGRGLSFGRSRTACRRTVRLWNVTAATAARRGARTLAVSADARLRALAQLMPARCARRVAQTGGPAGRRRRYYGRCGSRRAPALRLPAPTSGSLAGARTQARRARRRARRPRLRRPHPEGLPASSPAATTRRSARAPRTLTLDGSNRYEELPLTESHPSTAIRRPDRMNSSARSAAACCRSERKIGYDRAIRRDRSARPTARCSPRQLSSSQLAITREISSGDPP